MFGVASAAYQIEGAYNEGGRGESVWDRYSHTPGNILHGHTGDVACDHYHRYKEDVALMASLGIKAYRFSISWSRLIPDGAGELNPEGVKFYSDLIDELLKNGIEPYVTLFHWDYPTALFDKGGWLNQECILWFAKYAEKVVSLYSDRVKYFITFNEPQCFIGQGYEQGIHAPGLKLPFDQVLQIAHNVMKAHGAAVIAMRKAAKQQIKIGYAPTCSASYPKNDTPEDIEAARRAFFACPEINGGAMWNVSWWSDPVILGKYPEDGLRLYRDYLPKITEEDMRLISQPIDFYAQNIYNGHAVEAAEDGAYKFFKREAGYAQTAIGWPVTPEALCWGPRFLYERYRLPIVISENGMADTDWVSLDGGVHDPARIDFITRYVSALRKAADCGVDIDAYFYWSFTDNFEWTKGYTARFGLVYVDYATQKRIVKDSGYWYSNLIKEQKNRRNKQKANISLQITV